MSWLDTAFGDRLPLVRQFSQSTLMFLVLLGGVALVRHTIELLFDPSDFMGLVLRLVDAYATMLALVGYVIWISLDMWLLLKQIRQRSRDEVR